MTTLGDKKQHHLLVTPHQIRWRVEDAWDRLHKRQIRQARRREELASGYVDLGGEG